MILELKDIRLSFAGDRGSARILEGLDMNVPRGKITALIGGNGAGKTTLFNVITGFQKGHTGEVRFAGRSIGGALPHQVARWGVGRLFQGKPLLPELTLLENMKLASPDTTGEIPFSCLFRRARLEAREKAKEARAIAVLDRLFGVENKYRTMLHHPGSDFSGGEQRLLSLAGLFMGEHSLLLLDEPTAGVNPKYIESIKGIIRRMVDEERKTVLLIEHNMPFIGGVADTCAFLENGRIDLHEATEKVLGDQRVRNSYLGIR